MLYALNIIIKHISRISVCIIHLFIYRGYSLIGSICSLLINVFYTKLNKENINDIFQSCIIWIGYNLEVWIFFQMTARVLLY